MFLSRATFGSVPHSVDPEDLRDALDAYLLSLQRNGQICGDFLHSICNGEAVAYVYAARPDSPSTRFHSLYGLKDLDSLREMFRQEPVWSLLSDDVPASFPEKGDSSYFVLFSSAYDGESPVCCGDTGTRLPSYLIPIDYDDRERLVFWSREYDRIDGIWMASGELEVPAYEQLASPSSQLARTGRELAAIVEAALGSPVYYYLLRYYGRGDAEPNRTCPGCNGKWTRNVPSNQPGFWHFPFRCSECRLLSHFAYANYDSSRARVGEYQPPSAVNAAE